MEARLNCALGNAQDLRHLGNAEFLLKAQGKKSMAYSLSFRNRERTLTDAEVNAAMDKVRNRLAAELKVELR